jgi:hypothetical protein
MRLTRMARELLRPSTGPADLASTPLVSTEVGSDDEEVWLRVTDSRSRESAVGDEEVQGVADCSGGGVIGSNVSTDSGRCSVTRLTEVVVLLDRRAINPIWLTRCQVARKRLDR